MKLRSTFPLLASLILLASFVLSCGVPTQPASRFASMTLSASQPLSGLEAMIAFDNKALEFAGVVGAQEGTLPMATEVAPGSLRIGAIAMAPVEGDLVMVVFRIRTSRGTATVEEMFAVDEADRRTPLPAEDIALEYGLSENPAKGASLPISTTEGDPSTDSKLGVQQTIDACAIDLQATFANFTFGDVNASGESYTGIGDAISALNIGLGAVSNPSDFELYHADLNGDCVVNVTDALMILTKWVNPVLAASLQVAPSAMTITNGGAAIALVGNAGRRPLAAPTLSLPPGITATDISASSSVGIVYRLEATASAVDGQVRFDSGSAGTDSITLSVVDTSDPLGTLAIDVSPNDASWIVRAESEDGTVVETGNGDENVLLPPGTYWVGATKAGYETDNEIVAVHAGQSTRVTITLSETIIDTVIWRTDPSAVSGRAEVQETPAEMVFRIYNDGNSTGTYQVSGVPSWATLEPVSGNVDGGGNDYDSIKVTFERCANETDDEATVNVGGDGHNTAVSLKRSCTAGPSITVTPSTLDFGSVDVGDEETRTFTVKNAGGGVLEGAVSGLAFPFTVVSGGSYSLESGESQSVRVQFSPVSSTSGVQVDTARFSGGGGANRTVRGEAPLISLSPASLDFGSVDLNNSSQRSIIVTNAGAGVLKGSVSGLAGPFSVVSGGNYELSAGESQTVRMQYSPTTAGQHEDFARFSGGGGLAVRVAGEGVERPPAPDEILNLAITSPYAFHEAQGNYKCGVDFDVGVLGQAAAGPTVGPAPSGAPYRWACVRIQGSPTNVSEYVIVRRVFGQTTPGTRIATIDAAWASLQFYVDLDANGTTRYEYGAMAVSASGAESATTWSGYPVNPASNFITTNSLAYFNCAGIRGVVTDKDSLLYSCPAEKAEANWGGAICPLSDPDPGYFSRYRINWTGTQFNAIYFQERVESTGYQEFARTLDDADGTDHWRVFVACSSTDDDTNLISGFSLSETRRFVVSYRLDPSSSKWGTDDLPSASP